MNHRFGIAPLLAATLAGCGLGFEPIGTADDSAGAVTIESIDPSWGPPEGGTVVAITGTGFEGTVEVLFGAAGVSATRTDEGLLVTTPAANMEVTVDVTVRSDLGEAVAEDGYTFSNDAPDDDTGGPVGGVGGLVEFQDLLVACDMCFSKGSTAPGGVVYVSANAAFHSPVDGSWYDWMPQSGSCVSDPRSNPLSSSYLDAGEWVYLASGSVEVGMRKDQATNPVYVSSNLTQADFVETAGYDLSVSGGPDLGAFDANDALETPQSFDSVTPSELLNDARSAFAPVVMASGTTFSWTPSGGNGSFFAEIDAYNAAGTTLLGSTVCLGPDNGSMRLSSADLDWPSGSLLAVWLCHYVFGSFTISPLDAAGESDSSVCVLGTATLR
jgi:hypothetical protein